MTQLWFKSILPIAAIFSFRMLGLFMLIPVFTTYAQQLSSATPLLIGVALGGYGLSQGLLQIPFGLLSDKFGRKPVLTGGLLLFAFGSLLGAFSDSIYTMILARILQGSGAIGCVLIALLADVTPDETRTKAMALVGVTIGFSFSLAMVLSPAISQAYGLSGIFYLSLMLASLSLVLVHTIIPTPKPDIFHKNNVINTDTFKATLRDKSLIRLDGSIFFQHLIFTATFFAMPLLFQQHLQAGLHIKQWHFYLPLVLTAFVVMLPFIMLAEKKHKMKNVLLGSVIITSVSQCLLAFFALHWTILCGLMFLYFVAFNILEACLPALVSRLANPNAKGTAMGIYSSSQFLGIFAGGVLAGCISHFTSISGIFLMNAILALLWGYITYFIDPMAYFSTKKLPCLYPLEDAILMQLKHLQGVKEVRFSVEESAVYLFINKLHYQEGSAERILQ